MSEPTPTVDDLDAAYAEIARAPYVFSWQGREWTLPHIGELDYRVQAEIEAVDALTLEQVDSLFKKLFGPEQADAWVEVTQPGPFLSILFERWLAHSGSKPGESRASHRSSKSTGTKSRPTSAASTRSGSPKPSTAKQAPRIAASPPASSST